MVVNNMTVMAKVIETNDSDEINEEEEQIMSDQDEGQGAANAGWVDSIAKILKTNKRKGRKNLVLSKAKKLSDVKRTKTKPAGFEVATTDGEIKEEEIEVGDEKTEEESRKKKKIELPSVRIKPDILERDRERTLTKIATRGVVQLFNAVKMQQKDISKKLDEAGFLEVRKEKVWKSIDKRAFLDVLNAGGKSQTVEVKADDTAKPEKDSSWSVFHEDFMMGAKLKDWDKEVEEEAETEGQMEVESEDE